MARQSRRKQVKKAKPRKRGGEAEKAGCDNIGCVRIRAGGTVDVPVDGTDIFYCPDEEVGHPEKIWRVTNTTNENGFLVADKEGYTGGSGTPHLDTVQARKFEYQCETGYLQTDEVRDFRIYKFCRDRKCR